jgi:hypothetical protein
MTRLLAASMDTNGIIIPVDMNAPWNTTSGTPPSPWLS